MDTVGRLLAAAADLGWQVDLDQLPVICGQAPALVLALVDACAAYRAATAGVQVLDDAAASLRTVIDPTAGPLGDVHVLLLAEVLGLTDTRRHAEVARRRLVAALQALQPGGITWPPEPTPAPAPGGDGAANPASPTAPPPPEEDISRYVEAIMTVIDADVAAGRLPGSVACFADLHDYVDANDYLQAAGVPLPTAVDGLDSVVAVQEGVSRRLCAPGRAHCTYGAYTYPGHDHTTTRGPDGADLDEPVALRCHHCGQPAHCDEKLHRYRHDDPAAPDCLLIRHNPR